MLEVRDLHVRYGPIRALRGVDLDVSAGEAVGLIGPNGAGKTTLLSAIVGAVRPSQGSVTFEGASVLGRAPEAIVRTGIALVPEGRQIFGTLSVAENLMLAAKSPRDGAKPETEEVLELFPVLRTYYRSSAGKLSGGEQQQLAIARALLLGPRLLLLDEPSLGLAPKVVSLVFDVLERLRREGTTLLLVEQVARRTIRFADRTYVLRNGEIATVGTSDELLQHDDVSAAYLGHGT
jgi:branched-chain amino acid transport system ATP-binding protein